MYDEVVDLIRTTYAFKVQKKVPWSTSIYKYWVENQFSDQRHQLEFFKWLFIY